MQSAEQQVLDFVAGALDRGEPVCLCTLVQTVGAAPRPVGTLFAMALAPDQHSSQCGSLSGGCIEEDLLERFGRTAIRAVPQAEGRCHRAAGSAAELISYGLSAEQNARLGLPCGGQLTVLMEWLGRDHLPALTSLRRALAERVVVRRQVDLHSGQWQISQPEVAAAAVLSKGLFQQDLGPRLHLLLVGANALAQCIADIAQAMDYRVMVTDPRPEPLLEWQRRNPDIPALAGMPDDVVRRHARDRHSIVITLTHDPRIDDMALMEALTLPLFYVGALGSRRTSVARRQRLLELNLQPAQVDKLHAPVGLAIGSQSAMEIAVAIMAQLTQLRTSRQ